MQMGTMVPGQGGWFQSVCFWVEALSVGTSDWVLPTRYGEHMWMPQCCWGGGVVGSISSFQIIPDISKGL